MKGPFERLKYDLRRTWECPVCKRHERTPGSVTARHCLCQMKQLDGKPVVMKLVEEGPRRNVPPVVIVHEPLPPLPPLVIEPDTHEPEISPPLTGDMPQGLRDEPGGSPDAS